MDGMETSTPAVVLDRLTKTYRSGAGKVAALRDVTYAFSRGSFTAVMGASGSGKSTLLQCAAGLDRPSSGRVLLGDTDLGTLNPVRLTKLRRARMGFVFQAYNLLPSLSAYENVALPLRLAGAKPQQKEIGDVLHRVGLGDMGRRRPAELSGGEPTGALDTGTSRQILGLLQHAKEHAGQTVVMVTHDPMAAAYADIVVFLEDGQIAGTLRGAGAGEIAAAMSELEK